jgi:hypothetical protein
LKAFGFGFRYGDIQELPPRCTLNLMTDREEMPAEPETGTRDVVEAVVTGAVGARQFSAAFSAQGSSASSTSRQKTEAARG